MRQLKRTERLRLGIIFNFSPGWMGGIIYVINLVKALDFLEDEKKPEIIVFYNPDLRNFLSDFDYPYLELVEYKFPSLMKGFIYSWVLRRNIFIDRLAEQYSLDTVFPAKNYPIKSKSGARIIAWYADLQHKYYPDFFTRFTLLHRSIRIYFMLKNTEDLVVSSQSVKDDFIRFFRLRPGLRIHVYHFVSINHGFDELKIEDIRLKYQIPEKYFLVSNQFHKHKNHNVVLKAIAALKSVGITKHIAITGRFPGSSTSPYIAELHKIIEENNLSKQISMLGIIPRNEQMLLMKNCQAVIQPSLFEGWSTVIEDAISIQVPVIASNIKVNIEQLKESGVYFNSHSSDQLASILQSYPDRDLEKQIYGEYSERIRASVNGLIKVFEA